MTEDFRAYIDLDDKRVRVSTRRACMVGEDLKKGCYYGFAVSSKDPTIYGKNLISRKYVTTTDRKPPPMVYGRDEEIGENLDKVTKTKPQDVTIIEELKTGGSKKKELKKINVTLKEAKQPVKGKEIKGSTSSKYYDKKFIEHVHEKKPTTNINNLEKVAEAFEKAFITNKLYEVINSRLSEGLGKFRGKAKKRQPIVSMSPEQIRVLERRLAEQKARIPELNKFLNNKAVYQNPFFGLWIVNRLLVKDPEALKQIMKRYPKIEANISLSLGKVLHSSLYADSVDFKNMMKGYVNKWKPSKKETKKLDVKLKEAKKPVKGKEVKAKKPKKELTREQKDARNAKARERYRIKQKPKREAKCKEWLK